MSEGLTVKEREPICARCKHWTVFLNGRTGEVSYICEAMMNRRGVMLEMDARDVCEVDFFEELKWGEVDA